MSADNQIEALKLDLPSAAKPAGLYQPVLIRGNFAYVSGHGPLLKDGTFITGKVGGDLDVAAAKAAARQTGLAILASLRAKLGSLDRVKQVVKSFGMVNAVTDFNEHPAVINGYSELMAEVFGPEAGVGARSAMGAGSLPLDFAVEIEAVFEIK
jgi:enamine deaminase RidA (YjgF/YER057c/UK114 family)